MVTVIFLASACVTLLSQENTNTQGAHGWSLGRGSGITDVHQDAIITWVFLITLIWENLVIWIVIIKSHFLLLRLLLLDLNPFRKQKPCRMWVNGMQRGDASRRVRAVLDAQPPAPGSTSGRGAWAEHPPWGLPPPPRDRTRGWDTVQIELLLAESPANGNCQG